MKVLVISPGGAPIPVTKGGAVESLVEYIVRENENKNKIDLSIASFYEEKAKEESKKYHNTSFIYVKIPNIIKLLDKIICFIATKIFRQKKVLRFSLIMQRLFYISKIKKFLKNNTFDKVILENHIFLLRIFKSKQLRKKYKDKYYYHEHNVFNKTFGCDTALYGCAKIITVSNYISKEFHKNFPKYPVDRVIKLSNVADLERFRIKGPFNNYRHKFKIEENEFIVLFAGRIDETKGVLEVIKAFKKVNLDHTRLLIVGSYNYGSGQHSMFERNLYDYAKELGDKVVFTGFVSFYEMPFIYNIANLIVLPSIWEDPAPLSIIEALSCGKALITTNSGGIPEYAEDAAVILNRDDDLIDNLAKEICSFIESNKKVSEYEKKAFNKTNDWTLEKYYKDYLEIID